MRKPNHIILDFKNTHTPNSTQYWASRFLEHRTEQPQFMNYANLDKKYLRDTMSSRFFLKSSKLTKEPSKFTLGLSGTNLVESYDSNRRSFLKNLQVTERGSLDKKIQKNLRKFVVNTVLDKRAYLNLEAYEYSRRNLKRLFLRTWSEDLNQTKYNHSMFNNLSDALNVNFLRKERLYTKLKYSRTPAYDIVSGGAAALLAGFIGFLVSEKFGFELVDSGDFYFFFMYVVFVAFSVRPLLMVADPERGFIDLISLRRTFSYYNSLVFVIIYKLKNRR